MPKLTVPEYRKLRKISEKRVYDLVKKGKLKYTKEFIKPTILIEITEEEYNTLLANH